MIDAQGPGRESVLVLTGATSGIGQAAAKLLARRVGTLVVHGPEPAERTADLVAALAAEGAEVRYLSADFTRLAEVRRLATVIREAMPRVDALVNNAAVPGAPERLLTPDGNERTLQVNYLSTVLLTQLLLPAMPPGSRVVDVSSATHATARLDLDDLNLRYGYDPVTAYSRSKLAIVTHATALAGKVADRGVDVVSLHPGVIGTRLLHAMFSIGGTSTKGGGRRIVEALSPSVPSGSYLDDGSVAAPNPQALDPEVQRRLAEVTQELLGDA